MRAHAGGRTYSTPSKKNFSVGGEEGGAMAGMQEMEQLLMFLRSDAPEENRASRPAQPSTHPNNRARTGK
ncbi:hypothetical protein EON67_10020 [archaeon]|nr:MAG: hypothetical protein EON67_10020 [archaeon]